MFRYLARYTHRIAISDSRITAFDGETVSFRHRKPKGPGQSKPRYGTMTVSVDEFIRRFLLHVLPDGMHRIRHFGILANGCRARTLERAREALGPIGCPDDECVDDDAPEGERERDEIADPGTAPVACPPLRRSAAPGPRNHPRRRPAHASRAPPNEWPNHGLQP